MFRHDINGLRAAAVLAVMIFHLRESWLPGGFVGVDVFFVISGYLMTSIIFTSIANGRFSITQFYASRARRIIPALSVLCLAVLLFGYLFVIPKDYEKLAKHAFDSLLFLSNHTYLAESGYFDAESHEKWLLHTWSLSAEWQFYLLYPIVVAGLVKALGLWRAKIAITGLALIGFAASLYASYAWPSGAFFIFPVRAWEMLLGGIAMLWPIQVAPHARMAAAITGWLAVLLSCFMLDSTLAWPGVWALLPAAGTFAIIHAGHINARAYANRITRAVGKHSYSLYLWHWPIIVAFAYLQIEQNIPAMIVILAVLSAASFNLLEKRRTSTLSALSMAGAVLAASFAAYSSGGALFRVLPEYRLTAAEFHEAFFGGSNTPVNEPFTIGERGAEIAAIFAGDSFGHQYMESLKEALPEKSFRIQALFDHGCLIGPNLTRYIGKAEDTGCSKELDTLAELLSSSPSAPLILAFSWSTYEKVLGYRGGAKNVLFASHEEYLEAVIDEMDSLIKIGGAARRYYLVGAPQSTSTPAFRCLSQTELLGARLLKQCNDREPARKSKANEALSRLADSYENVEFIDPSEVLCAEAECLLYTNRKPIHTDGRHLSVYGADMVVPLILSKINLGVSTITRTH